MMIRSLGRTRVTHELRLIDRHLRLAEQHVAQATGNLSMQRQIIEALQSNGGDARVARMLLISFETTLAIHTACRDRLDQLKTEAEAKRGSFLRRRWL